MLTYLRQFHHTSSQHDFTGNVKVAVQWLIDFCHFIHFELFANLVCLLIPVSGSWSTAVKHMSHFYAFGNQNLCVAFLHSICNYMYTVSTKNQSQIIFSIILFRTYEILYNLEDLFGVYSGHNCSCVSNKAYVTLLPEMFYFNDILQNWNRDCESSGASWTIRLLL